MQVQICIKLCLEQGRRYTSLSVLRRMLRQFAMVSIVIAVFLVPYPMTHFYVHRDMWTFCRHRIWICSRRNMGNCFRARLHRGGRPQSNSSGHHSGICSGPYCSRRLFAPLSAAATAAVLPANVQTELELWPWHSPRAGCGRTCRDASQCRMLACSDDRAGSTCSATVAAYQVVCTAPAHEIRRTVVRRALVLGVPIADQLG